MAVEARLADPCESIVDCPHSTPVWTDNGVVVLRNQNIRNGRLDLTEPSYTDEAHFAERTRRALPTEGDLVITREAPMGEVCMIPPDLRCCLGQRMVLLRPNRKRAEPRYLLYALQSKAVQHEIGVNEGTGSTVSNLRIPLLESLPIPTRPLAEQRAIAHILGTLDDKIELNRRMNEMLEAMARALFKSWFVDFDPVRAKAEGRDPGLPKPLADLFPARLVDSKLGEIPEGWRASVLGEEVARCGGKIQTGPFGSQLHASDYAADGVPVVMPKDLLQRRVSTLSIARVSLDDAQRLSRHRLQQGDIVYSRRGDVERHGLVHRRETGWLCGTGCLLVRLGPEWPSPLWASFALDRPETRAWVVRHAIGATMPNLNTGTLARVPIVVPPDKILCAFNQVAQPFSDRVISADAQTETLVSLRDTLLPKLISGDLRVKDAKRFIEVIA
jgi:type I restriction enzyme S subunit